MKIKELYEKLEKETWTEKKNIFTDFVFTTEKKVLCKNIRKRSAIPLLG